MPLLFFGSLTLHLFISYSQVDFLLHNLLPKTVADRLSMGLNSYAESFSDCGVMFIKYTLHQNQSRNVYLALRST